MSVSPADLPGLNPADDFSVRDGPLAFLAKLVQAYQDGRTDHLGVFVPGYGKTLTALASFGVPHDVVSTHDGSEGAPLPCPPRGPARRPRRGRD